MNHRITIDYSVDPEGALRINVSLPVELGANRELAEALAFEVGMTGRGNSQLTMLSAVTRHEHHFEFHAVVA